MKQRINPIYLMNRPAHKIVQRVGQSTWLRSSGGELTAYHFIGLGADEFGKIKMMPRGAGSVTFTRDTAGSITDFHPLVLTGQVQEMRFDEARRVENIWPPGSSEDFSEKPGGPVDYSNATVAADGNTVTVSSILGFGFLDDFTVEPGEVYTLSIETSGGTCEGVTNAVRDQTNETFIFTDMKLTLGERSARAFTVPAGCTAIRCYVFRWVTGTGTIIFKNAQLERGNKVSEYVSKGVLSGPSYHGLNVDGVAQFAHDNGLTVDSNDKVTEANGADLTTEWGANFEPASRNEATKSDELDNVAWVATNATVTADQGTAPDGTNTAERMVFSGGTDPQVNQDCSIPGGTASKMFTVSMYLKSNTGGTQICRLHNAHGGVIRTRSSDLTLTTEWQRFSLTVTNDASTGSGIQSIAVGSSVANDSADILAWRGQLEEGLLTSSIKTDATAVTRTLDEGRLMYDINGNLDLEKGSMVIDLRWNSDYNDISQAFEKIISFANFAAAFLYYASDEGSIYSYDGTNACKISLPFVANKTYRIGQTWSVDNGINLSWKNITDSGSWQTWANTPFSGAYVGSPNGKIRIGNATNFYRPLRYRDLRIWQQDQGTQFIEDNY